MQFKHPEILYFLCVLVIPILVHLFQLRRFKKEYFTNVQFLKELSIQTRKSSKIKKWLLLITRLLLLAALITAFAQPFFKAKESKNSSNEMYIVLDNSYSMQAKGNKGELLKRAIQELLENTPENQTFSLITNSETYWNTDIKSIQKEIQNIGYSALPFQLESAMAKIKSRKNANNKDVIIITDAIGLKPKQLKSIDENFNTYFINPEAEQKENIAIDSVYMNQTLNDFYEIGVSLKSFGEQDNAIPIGLYNNNKLVAKTLVKFEKPEITIKFTIPKKDFNGYVSISDASLKYDNIFYFSITKPEKKNVISIGKTGKSGFLNRIYTPEEFNYNNSTIEKLNYNSIENQDAIVLNELENLPQALVTNLKSFVEKGGNLVFIPSTESKIDETNRLLGSLGQIQFGKNQNTTKLITKIAFQHPLFQSVFEKKISNFQYPSTKLSFEIKTSNPPILSYEDQSCFLTSIQNSISSVYVFSAPINTTNSNFQKSPLIVPVFYNMAQNAQKNGVNAMIIGDNKPFLVATDLSKDEILELKNETEKFIPTQQILNNKVNLKFNDSPIFAGNFGIYKKDKIIRNISFNYARTESNLEESKNNLLSDYKVVNSLETVFNSLLSDRSNNEIWKIFVILTLLFLFLEVLIQKLVK
ncbi:MAG: BatA and WFA domain-containing protein [Flavobacterium sp.]|nr:BatA and WFA domain-containing protein [Flavobacterium sp.]